MQAEQWQYMCVCVINVLSMRVTHQFEYDENLYLYIIVR